MITRKLFVLLLAVPAAAFGQTQKRPFKPADWYRLTTLSAPAMSPDGRLVAVTVTTVKEAENKRHAEVWVVPATGGTPVRYTSPAFESSNPRFSPDGKYLFFSSNRPGGRGNTWAIRLDQPAGEAFQVEGYPTGSMPRDKSFVVYAEADTAARSGERGSDPYREMQPMARPPFGAITQPLDAKRFDGRHVVQFPYKANGRGFVPNPREARVWRPTQIVMQTIGDTTRKRITNARYSHQSVAVSPDGKWVAFTADAQLRPDSVVQLERDSLARMPYDAKRDEADRNDADIFLMPIAGGEPKRLTNHPGSEGDLNWSPDGRTISFVSRVSRTKSARIYQIGVAGGTPENLLGDWKYEPSGHEWLPNGMIAFSASIGGRSALLTLNPKTKQVSERVAGRRQIRGAAYDDRYSKVAYVATSINQPTELYLADFNGQNERKLTGFNDQLNATIDWPDAERFTYTSVGGLEIEAWLQKPAGYQPGKKYPLVLYIHGGPHSSYGEGWFDEFHNLTGAGMFVLFTNPRGSSGYGADFTYSTRGRWGMEDFEDLMKAVDIAAKRPDVDSTRMGVTGGSYGGFMTAWVTTKTNRFKAAQADRMISNWFSWYGSSEAQGLTEFEFFGKPWDNWDLYEQLSPLKYVQQVRTPTLIVQSEEDHRTPITDAEQWFMALRKRGVPVEFVRYPRSNHDLSRTGEPWLLVDRLGRLRQWFTHWLKPEGPATTVSSENR
ncbi:MAG TPA: S9 family peptidase [Longimicrobiales bacterium]|nr:S9 family peptidase [Longimicrobiales bacterium]